VIHERRSQFTFFVPDPSFKPEIFLDLPTEKPPCQEVIQKAESHWFKLRQNTALEASALIAA
jgi:hypothetical protein